jgi:hypothetical protein
VNATITLAPRRDGCAVFRKCSRVCTVAPGSGRPAQRAFNLHPGAPNTAPWPTPARRVGCGA